MPGHSSSFSRLPGLPAAPRRSRPPSASFRRFRRGSAASRRSRGHPSILAVGAALVLASTLTPSALAGQGTPRDRQDEEALAPPRIHAGASLAVAQALGQFSEYVRVGAGIQAHLRVDADESGYVGVRLQGMFLNYGNETRRVCLSSTVGCRIEVDLTTSNNIFVVGLGPELALPLGSSRLYGNALVGFGYFSTDSEVRGGLDRDPFASTRNFGDGGLSWSAGGGVEIPVARAGGLPISVDLGLAYQGNGRREYLTRGGITDLPDGSLQFDVKRSEADFLVWRAGVSVGLRPGGM